MSNVTQIIDCHATNIHTDLPLLERLEELYGLGQ
jgi:hypothetical protein